VFTSGLTHYWPVQNSQTIDVITGTAATSPSPNFATDRYNNPTGAIGVRDENTYWAAAADVYFASEFSATFWSKIYTYVQWIRIFDFGNGAPSDSVLVHLNGDNTYGLVIFFNGTSTSSSRAWSPVAVPNAVWVHMALVLSGDNMLIYQNGTLVSSATSFTPPQYVDRTNAFIGKSEWTGDPFLNGDIDDLKIFGRAITAQEVLNDFGV
jgi:hypothetical protein